MDELFEIPVLYKNEEILFTAQLLQIGYVHKFLVDVYGTGLFFEQDDNGNYRALAEFNKLDEAKHLDVGLLKAIVASIENILK